MTASIAAQQVKLLLAGGALIHMTHEDRQVAAKMLCDSGMELADAAMELSLAEVNEDGPTLRLVSSS